MQPQGANQWERISFESWLNKVNMGKHLGLVPGCKFQGWLMPFPITSSLSHTRIQMDRWTKAIALSSLHGNILNIPFNGYTPTKWPSGKTITCWIPRHRYKMLSGSYFSPFGRRTSWINWHNPKLSSEKEHERMSSLSFMGRTARKSRSAWNINLMPQIGFFCAWKDSDVHFLWLE